MKAPDYIIPATADSKDLELIDKVYNKEHLLLKNNAKFALGIVTGDNRRRLLQAPSFASEPIFRGKDIEHFRFLAPQFHIEFQPAVYQQVAPLELYRRPKIVYRFISDKIVCALDSSGRLLLNSANLFIPTFDYPMETIVALFNSKLYTYLYRKRFHSKKVLRSHLESFPLPLISEEQHARFKNIHDTIVIAGHRHDELDQTVYTVFDLTSREIGLIDPPAVDFP
jgi:hypothetical protein